MSPGRGHHHPVPFLPFHIPFRLSSGFLPLLFSLLLHPPSSSSSSSSSSSCPPSFHARAISSRQLPSIHFYHFRPSIPSAADCAALCASHPTCLSAVFNHNSLACALSRQSGGPFGHCRTTKIRFNSFHLTADGTEALSMLSCIEPCRRREEKLEKSGVEQLFNIDISRRPPPAGQLHNVDEPARGRHHHPAVPDQLLSNPPAAPIVPVNSPLANQLFHRHQEPKSIKGEFSSGADNFPVPDLLSLHEGPVLSKEQRQQFLTTDSSPSKNDIDGGGGAGFLAALQRLHQIQKRLEMILREAEKEKTKDTVPSSSSSSPNLPSPSSSSSSVLLSSKYSVRPNSVDDENGGQEQYVRTVHNGSEYRMHSGGFIQLLRPGGRGNIAQMGWAGPDSPIRLLAGPADQTALFQSLLASPSFSSSSPSSSNDDHHPSSSSSSSISSSSAFPKIEGEKGGEKKATQLVVINGKLLTPNEAAELIESEERKGKMEEGKIRTKDGKEEEKEEEQALEKPEKPGNSKWKEPEQRGGQREGADVEFPEVITLHGVLGPAHGKDRRATETPPSPSPSLDTGQEAKRKGEEKGTAAKGIVCFRFIQRQQLQHAVFATIEGLTLNECRCACAETWRNEKCGEGGAKKRCRSMQYREAEGGKCELNRAGHEDKFDLVMDRHSDYHYVSCEIKYLVKTAEKMCNEWNSRTEKKRGTTNGGGDGKTGTGEAPGTTALPGTSPSPEATTPRDIPQTPLASSNSADQSLPPIGIPLPNESSPTSPPVSLPSPSTLPSSSSSTSSTPSIPTTSSVSLPSSSLSSLAFTSLPSSSASSPPSPSFSAPPSLGVNASGCFERIPGFAMHGTAAGLEHSVSIDQCECLCAHSLALGLYAFQCVSATYYHSDRDCVLNVESRFSSPELFTKPGGMDEPTGERDTPMVTYLGIICPAEKAMAGIEKGGKEMKDGCGRGRSGDRVRSRGNETGTGTEAGTGNGGNQTAAEGSLNTTTAQVGAQQSAVADDKCFREWPDHVLQGMALAVETNSTLEQCKCLCARAQVQHGVACQSIQYYFDSMTCLLNRKNRLSDPDHFSFISPSPSRHSYFDFGCGNQTDAEHLNRWNCGEIIATTATTEGSSPTTTAELKILKKKRRKGRKGKGAKSGKKSGKKGKKTKTTKVPVEGTTTSVTEAIGISTITVTTTRRVSGAKLPAEAEEVPEEEEAEMRGWGTVPVLRGDDAPPQSEQQQPRAQSTSPEQTSSSVALSSSSPSSSPTSSPSPPSPSSSIVPSAPPSSSPAPITSPPLLPPTTPSASSSAPAGSTTPAPLTSTTTTTLASTTTTTSGGFEYPPVGPCRFSALYQTVFNGARVLKRLLVESPAQCLAACHFEGCRSANLIQMEDRQKVCELFRDSIVEWRRNDVLSFDRLAVHFDSIQCQR